MTTYRLKGASGPVANQVFSLGDVTVIGRDASCDLVLEDPSIAPRHAEMRLTGGRSLRIQRLGGTEVRVNGKPVEQANLASGDEIRIGACRWVLQAPGLRPSKVLTAEAIRRPRSWLLWLVLVMLALAAALVWQRGWLPFF